MTTQNRIKTVLTLAAVMTVALALTATSANAVTIAATNFDGRTLINAGATATNLNWTTNGVTDPGDMTALRAGTTNQALFDGNALTQNMFAPALNVGNSNTFWTTTVDLAASAGNIVTVTDVTFDYWAISGNQVHNVNRASDFTVTLFNPSNVAVGSDFIDNAVSGTGAGVPTITANLGAVTLSDPGTYTLEIIAAEAPETGNHIGIDNLSINGDVAAAVVPEPSTLVLVTLGLLGLIGFRRRRRNR